MEMYKFLHFYFGTFLHFHSNIYTALHSQRSASTGDLSKPSLPNKALSPKACAYPATLFFIGSGLLTNRFISQRFLLSQYATVWLRFARSCLAFSLETGENTP